MKIIPLFALVGVASLASSAVLLAGVTPASGFIDVGQPALALSLSSSIESQSVPTVTIGVPSSAIGDLGANLGNVWDMDSTSDIVWRQENFPVYPCPSAGCSTNEGTIVRGYVPKSEGLLSFGLYASSTPLDSVLYHHLLMRLKIQMPDSSCFTNGRAALATRFPNWYGSSVSTYPYAPHWAPMNCPYDTFCTYYVDLARNNNNANHITWHNTSSPTETTPWTRAQVRGFAIVPHEQCFYGGAPDFFEVDYVYLTGDIVARQEDSYLFTARWNVSDADPFTGTKTITSTVRYLAEPEMLTPANSPTCGPADFDTDWNDFDPVAETVTPFVNASAGYPYKVYFPVIARTLVPGDVDTGNTSLQLDFTNVGPAIGRNPNDSVYYLCIRVDDGEDYSYAVSSAPVLRAPLPPWFGAD